MPLLPSIPIRWFAAIGLLIAAVLWHTHQVHNRIADERESERNGIMSKWHEANAKAEREELARAIANARTTVVRLERQGENHDAAVQAAAAVSADRARARDAERVQHDYVAVLESIAAGAAASDSASVADRQAAAAAARMLAELQRRADALAGVFADFADAAHIAGNTCQRDYEALRP